MAETPAGTYRLRLTATAGPQQHVQEMVVTVDAPTPARHDRPRRLRTQ